MHRDLTKGPVVKSMLMFAIPMILGNLLQQCYNIADTMIVGQFLGHNALVAVGVVGIWWSVPIGWFLADLTDLIYYKVKRWNYLLEIHLKVSQNNIKR